MSNAPSKIARRMFESLPEHVRQDLKDKRAELRGLSQLKANQALLAARLAELEKRVGVIAAEPAPVVDPRFPEGVNSRICTAAEFDEPWFNAWCETLHEPNVAHRKVWEFAYIGEMLDRTKKLVPGSRGLGFGVGKEPLISGFAARGAHITATDLDPTSREAIGWIRSAQHIDGGIDSLRREGVIDPEAFRGRVEWRPVDMTDIPTDLKNYDFCWSTCALEHLGTLQAGFDFIEASVNTLKPGGIAVHTTEYNLRSNSDTIEAGPTVIYREKDVLAFKAHMESLGHEVAAFDFNQGHRLLDQYIDVPPYGTEPVVKFWYARYTMTSIGIVVRAKS